MNVGRVVHSVPDRFEVVSVNFQRRTEHFPEPVIAVAVSATRVRGIASQRSGSARRWCSDGYGGLVGMKRLESDAVSRELHSNKAFNPTAQTRTRLGPQRASALPAG